MSITDKPGKGLESIGLNHHKGEKWCQKATTNHWKLAETIRTTFFPCLFDMLNLTGRYLCPRFLRILVFLPDSYDTIKSSLYVNAVTFV